MYRDKILELNDYLDNINIGIKVLETNSIIQLYNEQKTEKEKINRQINSMTNKMQSECKHPIWYHVSTSGDYFEGRTYYMCKCLECGYQKERISRDFNKMVIHTEETFSIIQDKYFEFKKITNDINIIKSLLEEKFKGV